MRKTKIVCTIGPACSDEQTITEMVKAGMNVARLNFSHGTHADHAVKIAMIKAVRERLQAPVAIMLDTKGPEYRIGLFEEGKAELTEGDTFTFTTENVMGDSHRVSVSYAGLAGELRAGDRILVNNGILEFAVTDIAGCDIHCRVISGGEISNRKSMSFPNRVLKQDFLSEQDKSDLLFGIEQEVDYIACSFVSTGEDILAVKEFLRAHTDMKIGLIAKIENQSGIDHIDGICAECDGIMIGRGDMGVEIPFEELPAIQKQLITKCRMLGKRVITATEMLESMIHNPRPTRAEVSDVANAVYDGTSAVMLSGETAAGKYPVLTVATMAKIVVQTEQSIHYEKRFYHNGFQIKNDIDAVSHAICGMSIDLGARAIVACSISGMTVRMISRFRPPVDIIGFCVDRRIWHQLSLSWGVTPVLCTMYPSVEVLFYQAKQAATETFCLQAGDKIIITGGTANGSTGNTNSIRVETI